MLLYEAPGSPYAQKIKIALREKSVDFQLDTPESLGTGRTDGSFGTGNPRVEVPLLVDGQTRIFDSTIILEYIEERWPEPPLMPLDPAARAVARMIEDVCDTQYEAVPGALGRSRHSAAQRARRLRPCSPRRRDRPRCCRNGFRRGLAIPPGSAVPCSGGPISRSRHCSTGPC